MGQGRSIFNTVKISCNVCVGSPLCHGLVVWGEYLREGLSAASPPDVSPRHINIKLNLLKINACLLRIDTSGGGMNFRALFH